MVICLKVKTLDSQTYDFTVDDEISVKKFKEAVAEKINISADLQRLIYCGRVLVDEKPLKDYDVNGKVVHVVERPPPSLSSNNDNNSSRRSRGDGIDNNVRGSPFFRALDGMVVGAMSIPVSTSPQNPVHSLNPSSSFCMNRITVARHMLDCANNIASYLENPQRGLNNSSLDILQQARWTMESTVVEVGISAPEVENIPQNNLVEALHGAVSAALRQSQNHNNVTVLQMPQVFGSTPNLTSEGVSQNNNPGLETSASRANIETIEISDDDEPGHAPRSTSSPVASASSSNINASEPSANVSASESSTNESRANENTSGNDRQDSSNNGSPTRQRTRPNVLAEVINQMTRVQRRLNPFINRYYNILLNDPQFNEDQITERENSQRVFDRVSEALHYMSHAQHAISDLMLDLSQPTPRYLCCRPILVEQSGFVSTNNIASLLNPSNENNATIISRRSANANSNQQQQQQQQQQQNTTLPANVNLTSSNTPPPSSPPPPPSSAQTRNRAVPVVLALPSRPRNNETNSEANNMIPAIGNPLNEINTEITLNTPSRRQIFRNSQLQVARLIQAVMSSAPMDADLHVQINAPQNFLFGMPLQQQQQQQSGTTTTNNRESVAVDNTNVNANNINNNTTSNSAPTTQASSTASEGVGQARVTTATHPTTSTQTRSTPRPQQGVQIPPPHMWNTRILPANMVSSFDRFLPCSSHHIREAESNEAAGGEHVTRYRIYSNSRRDRDARQQQQQQQQQSQSQQQQSTTSRAQETPTVSSTSATQSRPSESIAFGGDLILNLLQELLNLTSSNPPSWSRIRSDLRQLIVNDLFAGAPINEENMNNAINNVLQLLNEALIFLPQFDLSNYDSRASIENFIRTSLPFMINLIRDDDPNEFNTRFLQEIMNFMRRLFVILVTCVGRPNAELYINQIAQMAITATLVPEPELLTGLRNNLVAALVQELDDAINLRNEVEEFLVTRRPSPEGQQEQIDVDNTPMETDEHVQERPIDVPEENLSEGVTPTSNLPLKRETSEAESVASLNESLPRVVVGSEPWHSHFPSNWLPIITRDVEKQRRQNSQSPFSDAYISGMSAKRRKLIAKPPTDIQTLITDGVRTAIENVAPLSRNITSSSSSSTSVPTGGIAKTESSSASSQSPSTSYTIEEISTAIGTDPAAQLSYREELRSNIQKRLQTDTDYRSDKFPNSSKFFHK